MTVSKQSRDGVPNAQHRTPDDGQRGCPKHVELYNKKKLDN